LRKRDRDMGIGPYVDLATAAFDTAEVGAGAEWLIPSWEPFSCVLSAGALERKAPRIPWEPGVAATLFFGSRSYNFHALYGLTAGFFVQGRYGLGDARQGDLIAGVALDLVFFAYPFLLAFEAIAH
jgi:hypothetical protein